MVDCNVSMRPKSVFALAVLAALFYCPYASGAPWLGGGVHDDPYLIDDADDLQAVGADADYWNACFRLTGDIDLSGLSGTDFNIIGYYNSEEDKSAFTGVFDGAGHVISNFTYTSATAAYAGLFGYVGDGGTVKDLGLEAVVVDGGDNGSAALAGYNSGTISRCYAAGSVTAGGTVGGLVGFNRYGAISSCYSTVSVTGGAAPEVGGLVGYNFNGTISGCYAAGVVTSQLPAGGLAGISGGVISDCHWDMEVSGQGSMCVNAGEGCDAEGDTTAEMTQQATFVNWDFVETWDIRENQTYPFLRVFTRPCLGDMNDDGWLSPVDLNALVNMLLPHESNKYWVESPADSVGDMNGDGWLSPGDLNALVSKLLAYESNAYWVECP